MPAENIADSLHLAAHADTCLASSAPEQQLQTIAMEQLQDYRPPAWARELSVIPTARLPLALLPTPLQLWHPSIIPPSVRMLIKRDDLTGGMELAGNKVRMGLQVAGQSAA